MGLDNGIILEVKNKQLERELQTKFPELEYLAPTNDDDDVKFELFYWRRCWNVRSAIFDILNDNGVKTTDDCEFDMYFDKDVLYQIFDKLAELYTASGWDDTRSLWTYLSEDVICDDCKCALLQLAKDTPYEEAVNKVLEMEESTAMKGFKKRLAEARDVVNVLAEYEDGVDYRLYFYDSY